MIYPKVINGQNANKLLTNTIVTDVDGNEWVVFETYISYRGWEMYSESGMEFDCYEVVGKRFKPFGEWSEGYKMKYSIVKFPYSATTIDLNDDLNEKTIAIIITRAYKNYLEEEYDIFEKTGKEYFRMRFFNFVADQVEFDDLDEIGSKNYDFIFELCKTF